MASEMVVLLVWIFIYSGTFFGERKFSDGSEFPVYTTNSCPRNLPEWRKRSSVFSCNDSNAYMCIPNENLTDLLEFCYSKGQIQITKGLCPVLFTKKSIVDVRSCLNFTEGCPNSSYRSQDVEKYGSCVAIGKRCYLADPSCARHTTDSLETTKNTPIEDNQSSENNITILIWAVPVTVLLVIIAVPLCLYFRQKKLWCSKCKKDRTPGSNDANLPMLEEKEENKDCPNDDPHQSPKMTREVSLKKTIVCPKSVGNAVISPNCSRMVGESCNYSCTHGYFPTTSDSVVCTSEGSWEMDMMDNDTLCSQNRSDTKNKPFVVKDEDEILVVAIDFGTTYSGFAYSRRRYSEIKIKKWESSTVESMKTPTALLLNQQNSFIAFGYDAEKMYKESVEDEKHKKFRFFKNFKMELHDQKSSKSSFEIEDHQGKPLAAIEVFSKSLKYMTEEFYKMLKKNENTDYEKIKDKIRWIVTVPAIWKDDSKQFVRVAAEKAEIPSDMLTLALEPECAAICVLESPLLENNSLDPGEVFLVADLGGGTADFSLVEITQNHKLKHLHHPEGGAWGGRNINKAIFDKFEEIFTKEVMSKFKIMKADCLDMENQIEMRKRDLGATDKLSLMMLQSLSSLCQQTNNNSWEEMVQKSKYKDLIQCKKQNIVFEPTLINEIFESTAGIITNKIESIINVSNRPGINTIMLVGGFANSKIVYDYVKKKFPDKNVIVPPQSELSVLKGAVFFGNFQGYIEMRMSEYTYGIETYRSEMDDDPEEKKKYIGYRHVCTDVFEKLISKGDKVRINNKVERTLHASTENMNEMRINIYKSKDKNPQFITDAGCEFFAEMVVDMNNSKGHLEDAVIISIEFGRTQISFYKEDKQNNDRFKITEIYFR